MPVDVGAGAGFQLRAVGLDDRQQHVPQDPGIGFAAGDLREIAAGAEPRAVVDGVAAGVLEQLSCAAGRGQTDPPVVLAATIGLLHQRRQGAGGAHLGEDHQGVGGHEGRRRVVDDAAHAGHGHLAERAAEAAAGGGGADGLQETVYRVGRRIAAGGQLVGVVVHVRLNPGLIGR